MKNLRIDTAEHFWSFVDQRGAKDCWEWQAYRNNLGYGFYHLGGKTVRASRAAVLFSSGRPPEPGVLVCHRCDNPPCVNPAHLFLGSPQDNVRDMLQKGRGRCGIRQTELIACPAGHPYAGENLYITPTGKRMCRECARARTQEWRARRRQADQPDTYDEPPGWGTP